MGLKTILPFVFIFLICTDISAQKTDYTVNWKKIESLEKKGLNSSALAEARNVFSLAVAANNDVQQIKAAMYIMKYRNLIEEDNAEKNIFYIDTLIVKTKAPAKNILQSMQAELLETYRSNNRYKFYNRTKLAAEKSNDVSTWSIEKLNSTVTGLYKTSLTSEDILKKIPMTEIIPIIEKGENTQYLRPTLYDFLAHRALTFFMSTENDLTSPSYKFILNDERIFAPANEFIDLKFATKDSGSLYLNALLLLQEVLKFHIYDANPDALLDADLIRLAFANKHGVFTDKDKLYETALKDIEKKYSGSKASAQASFLRASLYRQQGNQYDPFIRKEFQFKLKLAKELCDSVISKFPNSEGAINCINLIAGIQAASLRLETEKVNIPRLPFRSLVTYKNINTLYVRVIKTSRQDLKRIENNGYDKVWQEIIKLNPVKSWTAGLPDSRDYQQHSTEIKIDALPQGTYLLLASLRADFNLENNVLSRQLIYVSNISYLSNNNDEIYVLDRDNGQPLLNAEVQLWQQTYNYTNRNYEEIKKEKYNTDSNGYIKIKKEKENNYNNYVQVKYNGDELFTDDSYYKYYNNNYEVQKAKKTFLFTDRSIYRPGQTVFFKGIVVSTDSGGRRSSIIPNYKTTVILSDANNQKAASLQLITNEYGSYNGSFKLPEGGLNGIFFLRDSADESMQTFSVEEYKRPKFIAEIKKPAGTYRVNDSIKITGMAKGYAGNNIDGAKLTYRVVRKTQYPFWFNRNSYRKIWPPYGNREEMEISNGETTTNSAGEFFIIFKAIPDETADKKFQPVFYYEVSANVTDINGETRSASTSIDVAYQALQLNILAPDKLDIDSVKNIKISSTNMNGLFEKTTINLTIQKLQSPGRIFRERYWEMPDQFTMNKEEYAKNFPYDEYMDENNVNKWPVAETLLNVSDTSSEHSTFNIQHSTFLPGWYKFTAITKDKYGEEVKAEKYIKLTVMNQPITDEPLTVNIKNDYVLPGQKISYKISTGFDKIYLIHTIRKIDKSINTTFPAVTKTAAYSNELNVSEQDRGGLNMNYAFVQHNRIYTGNQSFIVPWDNKDLSISYETFRDKILPGSEEKWKIKITGNNQEKIAAETLISMYDASLDQFKQHGWSSLKPIWPVFTGLTDWNNAGFTEVTSEEKNSMPKQYISRVKFYDDLIDAGWNYNAYSPKHMKLSKPMTAEFATENVASGSVSIQQGLTGKVSGLNIQDENKSVFADSRITLRGARTIDEKNLSADTINNTPGNNSVQMRKNFTETAFFFPSLNTDSNGNIAFSFTIPEALTTWKMMTLAHTKELASVYSEKTIITQKPLMVQPNAPRFLREGDQMEFSAKVINLSDSEITGTAQLELFDAATNKSIDGWFKNIFPVQYFTVAAGQSVAVKFPVDIPFSFNSALTYRIKAISKDGSFSDGEEAALPVLTNRILVTETMPLNIRNTKTKTFKFDKLLNSSNSGSLTNHALTVEFTSSPAWYAVQALPYLIEFPYECAEQSFNRYYANTLASFISNSTPKIKAVFEKWAALSPLERAGGEVNSELKYALLKETPWVLEAQNEAQQQKNIALLFDMVRLSKEKESTLAKLKEMQSSNGGFAWFKGGPDDRYITQYIITGIGHLLKLKALSEDYSSLKTIIDKALPYLDARLKEEYDNLKKYKSNLKDNNLSYPAIQYLYMRSFFAGNKISNNTETAFTYYRNQAKKFWLPNNKYMQAMIALALYKTGDEVTPKTIINSLKENAIYREETGMYFKEFTNSGYYWHQAPIESQSMMIEAFTDIDKNNTTIDDLKTWLLKQKQTQNWRTTKATAEACYALLLTGNNWLAEEKEVTINLGNTIIKNEGDSLQAGTGYFKRTIDGEKVQQGMGNITVTVNLKDSLTHPSGSGGSWGAIYWQYFEDLDKITPAETPLKLVKKLFIEKNSDKGLVLQALNDGDELHVGDKVKVRIELKSDRDMEYIHMKDLRAACMEPVNVISEYKWQGGLGYYETTKDASTSFFFNWLPRGTYVFEYPMFVTNTGNFSNGITTIQCMYAPEFTSHSEGVRVNVSD